MGMLAALGHSAANITEDGWECWVLDEVTGRRRGGDRTENGGLRREGRCTAGPRAPVPGQAALDCGLRAGYPAALHHHAG